MRGDRSRAQALVVFAVLALHLALLWLLVDSSTTRAARGQPTAALVRIALRLIAAAPVAVPPLARSQVSKPSRSTASPSRTSTAPRVPDTTAITEPQREAATHPDPAASADPGLPSLLDTEATRRAVRASARAASLGDQLARARDEPNRAGPQERLANDVNAAGKGDCLKGRYPGNGMGLLSLPFLAAAAVSGSCAK